MTTPTDPPTPFRVIGTTPLRHDGVDKVTGRAQYGADLRLPGMLHGAVLRSPHAHARIRSIDTRAAETYPGVRAVVTAQDLPELESKLADLGETTINLRYQSNNLLARDKVLYFGHAVAAVAAGNAHAAEAAAALIQVEYEVLPPVLDVHQAMQPGAPTSLARKAASPPISPRTIWSSRAISNKASARRPSLLSANSRRPWCTRVISSRTRPRLCSTRTAR